MVHGYYDNKNSETAYDNDVAIATVSDVFEQIPKHLLNPASYEEDGSLKAEVATVLKEAYTKCCSQLEAQLGDKKFFNGDKPGIADFHVTSFVYASAFNKFAGPQGANNAAYKEIIASFPNLNKHQTETMAEECKEHLAARFMGEEIPL